MAEKIYNRNPAPMPEGTYVKTKFAPLGTLAKVAGSVAVDDKDVAAFAKLRELGVELEIRRVPQEASESIEKLFK